MADLVRKTANLYDEAYTGLTTSLTYLPMYVGDGEFTLSTTTPINDGTSASLFFLRGQASSGASTPTNGVWEGQSRTITAINGYITIAYRYNEGVYVNPQNYNTMLNSGSTALPYEPYWLHSLRKLTTATEAVENPLYTDGTAITSYTIKGNTVQNGTPTPSNPVMPNGVGERTENLFNSPLEQGTLAEGSAVGSTYTQTKGAAVTTRVRASNLIYVGGTATISVDFSKYYLYLLCFDANQQYTGEYTATWQTEPVVVNTQYVGILIRNKNNTTLSPDTTDFNLMVNVGSTAKPYEPYGYKIPISSGGVTTNIYLGSTQTVRAIKKLVLTGQEDWRKWQSTTVYYMPMSDYILADGDITQICTHYQSYAQTSVSTSVPDGYCAFRSINDANKRILINDSNCATADDLKAYLAQQYANGTPVTIWYVLATAETGQVNEPLMKIGDYADTLSNAAQIPTTEGANSITVDTTVQPSEFTATWTGWHDASVKEWDGSDWQ